MKRKVDVTLLKRTFTVRTEKDEAYVHSLAAQVVRRLDDVRRQMRTVSTEEAALLVALNLADELAEQQTRSAEARSEVRRHTEAMIAKLTAALLQDGLDHAVPGEDKSRDDQGDDERDERDDAIVVAAAARQA